MFVSLFSMSPVWFIFNGTIVTIVLGMILTFILGKKILFEIRNRINSFF
jgi:hypothetical protein